HSVANGLRYKTLDCRVAEVTSCLLAEPFGHSRPRLIGESGSPSIWVTRPPETYTRWPQPTAQYGHTDWTTLSAVSVRDLIRSVLDDRAAAPRPRSSLPVNCR